jgi:limonene-1,2-epoxide hydrolase
VVGRPAIRAAVAGFFAAVGGCRHRLQRICTGHGTAVCEGEATDTRLDGSTLTVPFANDFELAGGRIRSYRIYIDNGPLFNARA